MFIGVVSAVMAKTVIHARTCFVTSSRLPHIALRDICFSVTTKEKLYVCTQAGNLM